MNPAGFVLPVLAIGLGTIAIKPQRGFFFNDAQNTELAIQVTLEEIHHDELEITHHPVESGAPIADHAFKRPVEVIIKCAWSNSPSLSSGLVGQAIGLAAANIPIVRAGLAINNMATAAQSIMAGNGSSQIKAIYASLIKLQDARIPFSISTGKRDYKDMLFKSLSVTTDKETENALMLTAVCQQVIIAKTQTVKMNTDAQANPEKTAPIADTGTKQLKG